MVEVTPGADTTMGLLPPDHVVPSSLLTDSRSALFASFQMAYRFPAESMASGSLTSRLFVVTGERSPVNAGSVEPGMVTTFQLLPSSLLMAIPTVVQSRRPT